MIEKVNLAAKFELFDQYWSPKIVGELNDFYVKVVKVMGEFVWHSHEREDELFYIVKGRLRIKLRQGELDLAAGEFAVIPHGVEHLPIADEETHVMLLEPKTTVNTGTEANERTVVVLQRI